MLRLTQITKDYKTASETVHALRGIDLSFRKNEFVSILGPSGCGKTTLLNIIGGLDHYTAGDLVINGRSTKSFTDRDWDVYRNHRVGFIFQSYNLIPHQTILGNVELALTIAGVSREERIERSKRALDRVGLSGQYYKKPNQLSGGQCQRVAIARALVNDPEILLADEPTGALDTSTSVQIMELIKEISKERLVVMVTHNPELAEQYSTRIVRLLDGELTEDTNPYSAEEEMKELATEEQKEEISEPKAKKKCRGTAKEKAKMSFFTAFRLSAHNLLSKKGRTTVVGFAGSIGIIGIALVLAFSAGIRGYIASMQDDMLSGNPITITETTYDLNAITGMMNAAQKGEVIKHPDKAHIDSLIEYIAEMSELTDSLIIKNDLTEEYVNYVKAMDKSIYRAMLLGYGLDMSYSIYTDVKVGRGSDKTSDILSVAALTGRYTAVLKGTDFSDYASYVTQIVPSFAQAPNNTEYIGEQYDVYGKIASEKDEIMIVLNSETEISDMLLARLGYYTEEEFYNLIYKVSKDEDGNPDSRYNPDLDKEYIDYSALVSEDKVFTWYPNSSIFTKNENAMTSKLSPFNYSPMAEGLEGGLDLKVVGVLVTNETTSYGCLKSGIYYTEALTNYVLEQNEGSEIVDYVLKNGDITSMEYMGMKMGVYYDIDYRFIDADEDGNTEGTATMFLGESLGIDDIMGAMGGSGGGSMGGAAGGGMGSVNMNDMKTISARMLGGVKVANSISIYPNSFEEKYRVTDYLDDWNDFEDKANVTYTDTLEIIIDLINTMIKVVEYALIAFTSVSLVVSTVMIGIITYVSVVERIKEIGVIRSLGGRKRDVSYLFNAETFIIGFLAGLFGIVVTYLISGIVNLILTPLIGYSSIAALPFSQALLMIGLSVGLTLISGLIPAKSAANKDPVVALRTE
jgi:putative ABC transport system permease protein